MDPIIGLSGYREVSLIATGGSSVVYRAYQDRFDRSVAVKVLTVDLPDRQARSRIEQECQAAGRLTGHPNIVTVLDAGTNKSGQSYLVMDFFERGSLADRLRREGPLPVAEVLRLGVKLAGALAGAHRAGVLHRDIKPANILLSRYDEPVLADFGIAGVVGTGAATLTQQALTPVHAAPEVLEGGSGTVASDIYSLGSVLYSALAGRPAFRTEPGEALLALMLRVLGDAVPPISEPGVPPEVGDVVAWAMAKDPAERPSSALELGRRLQEIQHLLGQPATDLLVASAEGPVPEAPVAGGSPTLHRPARDRLPVPPAATPSRRDRRQWRRPQPDAPPNRRSDRPEPAGPAALPPPTDAGADIPPPLTSPPAPQEATVARPVRADRVPVAEPPPPPPARHPPWIVFVACGVALVLAAGAAVKLLVLQPSSPKPPPRPAPVDTALTPTDLTASVESSTSILLSWRDHAHGRDSYVVTFNPAISGNHSEGTEPGDQTYLAAPLKPGTRYCFRVELADGPDQRSWPTAGPVCAGGLSKAPDH